MYYEGEELSCFHEKILDFVDVMAALFGQSPIFKALYILLQVCTGGRCHAHSVAKPVEYTVCRRRQMVGGSQSESGDP